MAGAGVHRSCCWGDNPNPWRVGAGPLTTCGPVSALLTASHPPSAQRPAQSTRSSPAPTQPRGPSVGRPPGLAQHCLEGRRSWRPGSVEFSGGMGVSCPGWWVPLGTHDPTLGSGSPWQPHPEATPWRQPCPQEADLGLEVRLQAQQAPDLRGSGVDDPGSHKIGRIRIDLFQERGTKPNNLCKGNGKLGHCGCGWTQGHPGAPPTRPSPWLW